MIVEIPMVLAIVTYINGVSSASFSKVFVQNGLEYPVEYQQYGSPSVSYNPHVARLTAAPVGSVVPYTANYVPCGSPCAYPGQVASVAPSAKIVQYQSPNLPVVVAPSSVPSGYEFSYIVYDEQTGDHKAQREHSDGSAVHGGYSFLQPDGFVREVQYVADDKQGFNAVVKNYLPVETKKHVHAEKPEVEPCNEVKNDHLKPHENQEEHIAEPSHANLVVHAEHAEDMGHEHNAEHHEAIKEHHEILSHHEPKEEHDETKSEHHEKSSDHHETHESSKKHETVAEQDETNGKHHENAEPSEEHHKDHYEVHIEVEEHHVPHEKPHEIQHEAHEEHHTEIHEHVPEHHEVHDNSAENDSEETIIHLVPTVHETHVAHTENDFENSNVLVPYNDIIRCIQSALSGVHETVSHTIYPHKPESPLTYIILNKPC